MKLTSIAKYSFLSLALLPNFVSAEVTTFGGDPERFKGDGDLEPPLCDLNVPTTATSPFFISWSCSDNNSPNDDLRSEVWIKAKGETIPKKVADFFGFPASVQVTEGLLKSLKSVPEVSSDGTSSADVVSSEASSFASQLPIEVKLLVRDRGGASAISKVMSVQSESTGTGSVDTSELSSCNLNISTPSSEASENTVGSASLSATADNLTVTTSNGVITASNIFSFSTCEIDEICKDDLLFSLVTNEAGNAFSLLSGNSSIVQSNLILSGSNVYSGVSSTTESGEVNITLSCQ